MSSKNYIVGEAGMFAFTGKTLENVVIVELNHAMSLFGISQTKLRMCHFLAQCAHESAGFHYTREIASGSDYDGRKDLGNTQVGDGPKFKGAGWIQLTGRKNYTAFSEYMKDPQVIVQGCRYVAKVYPSASAGFWWNANGLNHSIDIGATVQQVSRKVNRGSLIAAKPANGEAERVAYYKRALEIWG